MEVDRLGGQLEALRLTCLSVRSLLVGHGGRHDAADAARKLLVVGGGEKGSVLDELQDYSMAQRKLLPSQSVRFLKLTVPPVIVDCVDLGTRPQKRSAQPVHDG